MKKRIIYIFLIALVGMSSCTDEFVEMNKDPMMAQEIHPKYVFTHSQLKYTSDRYSQWRGNLILSHSFSGLTISKYTAGKGFQFNDAYNSALWERAYRGEIKDIEDVLARLRAGDQVVNANLIAAARVMRVLYYLRLTDSYGDIPYSEAGKGYVDNIVLPKYDKQEDIYADMLKELSEANEQFDASNPLTYEEQDILFNGNVTKWQRFTNSLKLRLAMRLSEVDDSMARMAVVEAIEAGVMQSKDDQAFLYHVEDGGVWGIHQNGASNAFWGAKGRHFPSSELMAMMKESRDPRLFQYFARNWVDVTNSNNLVYVEPEEGFDAFKPEASLNEPWVEEVYYVGYPAGSSNDFRARYFTKNEQGEYEKVEGKEYQKGPNGNTYDYYTALNHLTIADPLAPTLIMSYAEVKFLLAEAAHRNWGASGAQAHYEEAIRQAMTVVQDVYPGYEVVEEAMQRGNFDFEAGVAAYVNHPAVQWNPDKGLELIATEKWKTFVTNGYEAFAEWRRTGFPSVIKERIDETRLVNVYAKIDGVVDFTNVIETREIVFHDGGDNEYLRPTRLMYPGNEAAKNAKNFEKAVARMKHGNTYKSKVWWDAN